MCQDVRERERDVKRSSMFKKLTWNTLLLTSISLSSITACLNFRRHFLVVIEEETYSFIAAIQAVVLYLRKSAGGKGPKIFIYTQLSHVFVMGMCVSLHFFPSPVDMDHEVRLPLLIGGDEHIISFTWAQFDAVLIKRHTWNLCLDL